MIFPLKTRRLFCMSAPTEHPLIELSNVGIRSPKGSRRDWLVRDVSLTLNKKEIVTLIGPNGSGKSTTAKLALGLLKADHGHIVRRAKKISYVPQKVTIDWTLPLTVERFMRLTQPLSRQEVQDALRLTGAEHLDARAIARKPDLLVLDEPVQGVDYTGEIALYNLIASIRDTLNCGILLISHDLHIVMASTDRVLCLNGHVCCQGNPNTVIKDPAYQALFGHTAPSGLALYQHHHDHNHHDNGSVEQEVPHVR